MHFYGPENNIVILLLQYNKMSTPQGDVRENKPCEHSLCNPSRGRGI